MAGYSGTPLSQKPGIKPGFRIFVDSPPEPYRNIVGPLPDGAKIGRCLVVTAKRNWFPHVALLFDAPFMKHDAPYRNSVLPPRIVPTCTSVRTSTGRDLR
jgi:hypothetical protein